MTASSHDVCLSCGNTRDEHSLALHAFVAHEERRIERPERRIRTLTDEAHERLDAALDAAHAAGAALALADLRPNGHTWDERDRMAHAAAVAREHAHLALHALVRQGSRSPIGVVGHDDQ